MSCQQVPTTPAFNPYPRSVQVGEFEVAIGGGIWVAIRGLAARRLHQGKFAWPAPVDVHWQLERSQLDALVLGLPWQRMGDAGIITMV